MASAEFSVTLRIEHPSLRHERIEEALALRAHVAWSVGEQRRTPKGALLEGVNDNSYCSFDLISAQSGSFQDHLEQLLPKLKKHKEFLHAVRNEGGKSELFIGLFLEGPFAFSIPLRELARLEDLSLNLTFDIYD